LAFIADSVAFNGVESDLLIDGPLSAAVAPVETESAAQAAKAAASTVRANEVLIVFPL